MPYFSNRRLLDDAKLIAAFCLDGLMRLAPRPRRGHSTSRLCVVRVDALGDFVLWLPAARALRQMFPPSSHHITLIGDERWKELALRTSLFDEFWGIDRVRFCKDLKYRCRTFAAIRRKGFDSAIQMQLSREFFVGDSIVRACGASKRIGPRSDTANSSRLQLRISDHWYTELRETLPPSFSELERNADFYRKLTGRALQQPLAEFHARDFPSPLADRLARPFFVLAPGASIMGKMWPAANYAELARRLVSRFGWHGVICGDAAQHAIASAICAKVDGAMTDLTGSTGLPELFSVISRASLFIGNDTGPSHVAAAFGVPTVVILGGGHFGRFFPYVKNEREVSNVSAAHLAMDCFRCNWNCRYVDLNTETAPCVSGIEIEAVWQTICSKLRGRPAAIPT